MNDEILARLDELKAGQDELKADVGTLKTGQSELHRDVRDLNTRFDGLSQQVDEVRRELLQALRQSNEALDMRVRLLERRAS